MSTNKLIRDTERALERAGFSVLEMGKTGKRHTMMRVADASGASIMLTIGCTPRSSEESIDNTVKAAQRYLTRGASQSTARRAQWRKSGS